MDFLRAGWRATRAWGRNLWRRVRGREAEPEQPRIYNTHPPDALILRLVEDFRFIDQPYQPEKNTAFIGRTDQVQDLALRILFSDGGAVLVTGYRGVGKTSFVEKALAEAQRLMPLYEGEHEVRVIPINFNFSRELSAVELMYHVIRQLMYELRSQDIYRRLDKQLREWLDTAYQRTRFNVTNKQANVVSRVAQVGAEGFGLTPSAKLGRDLSHEESYTFLPYSTESAEYDLLRILRALSRGYSKRGGKRIVLKPVLIFDELDKIDSYRETDEGTIPNPYIRQVFGALKTLLTTSGVTFICVAGREFYDLWRSQMARGDSVLESVFAHHIYLNFLWELPVKLLNAVVHIPQHKRATVTLSTLEKRERSLKLKDKLEGYLRYQSRGIARRLHRELNRFVSWHHDGLALVFDDNAVRRLFFYDELDRVLREYHAWFTSPIADFDDRGLLKDEYRAVAYLITDRLLRFKDDAFTATRLIRSAGKVGVALKDEDLDDLARAVIRALTDQRYVETVDHQSSLPVQIIEERASTPTYYQLTPWTVLHLQDIQGGVETDVTEPEPVEWLEIRRLGNYEIVDKIGEGGLSVVYLGRDRQTYRRMAIKRARDSGGGIDVNLALRQEEKALRRAAGSGVVKVHEFQEEDPYHYLVLDYCDGKTLEDLLAARSAPLSREMSLALIMQAACILQHVHHEGVYRIDLKPGNIAFHNQEMIFIDFGTALIEEDEESLEWKALAMGTPDYAAPELMSNPESVDQRVDLYALGAIFYELLTGNPPTAEGPQLRLLPDDIAPVVQQLLAPSPEERYDSAVEFLSDLPGADAMVLSTVYDTLVNDMQETQVRRGQRTEIVLKDIVSIKRDTQPVGRRMPTRPLTGGRTGKSRAVTVTGPFSDCKTPFLESIYDGAAYSLRADRILIGRLNTCDVIIDDPSVSRIHALLQQTGRGYQLVDLHSYNGVMVNETRIQAEHLLRDGERFKIGPKEFIYIVPD